MWFTSFWGKFEGKWWNLLWSALITRVHFVLFNNNNNNNKQKTKQNIKKNRSKILSQILQGKLLFNKYYCFQTYDSNVRCLLSSLLCVVPLVTLAALNSNLKCINIASFAECTNREVKWSFVWHPVCLASDISIAKYLIVKCYQFRYCTLFSESDNCFILKESNKNYWIHSTMENIFGYRNGLFSHTCTYMQVCLHVCK